MYSPCVFLNFNLDPQFDESISHGAGIFRGTTDTTDGHGFLTLGCHQKPTDEVAFRRWQTCILDGLPSRIDHKDIHLGMFVHRPANETFLIIPSLEGAGLPVR